MPLNNVARAAIAELAKSGVTNLTPDEVLLLQDIGARMLDSSRQDDSGELRLTPPVVVGNATLHPPTCAASDFIDRWADDEGVWAYGFALAHAREPALLRGLATAADAREAIAAWRAERDFTADELWDAVALVNRDGGGPVRAAEVRMALINLASYIAETDPGTARRLSAIVGPILDAREKGRDERDRRTRPPEYLGWLRFAAELAVMTGVSPEYWYAEDRRLVLHCYRRAQETAAQRAASPFGGETHGQKPQGVRDAIRDMMRAKTAIRAAHARAAELAAQDARKAAQAATEKPANG